MTTDLETAESRPEHGALTLPDGRLAAIRDAPIGGQAVLEGVMMRGVSTWAVAVRKPAEVNGHKARAEPGAGAPVDAGKVEHPDEPHHAAVGAVAPAGGLDGVVAVAGEHAHPSQDGAPLGEIESYAESFDPWIKRRRLFRLPIVRGVVALAESLKIGFKALGISANAQLEEEEEKISGGAWGVTIALSVLVAVGLFFVLPVTIANFWKDSLGNSVFFVVIEKLIRVSIFLAYLWVLSRLPDLRRVFEYHGAEHKVISCYEAGDRLVPERAQLYSRLHPRCGTSFLLIVMIIAVFVFAPIGRPDLHWLILSRVLGIGLVAGLAYEVIKWASRHRRNRWVLGLMWPGLQLQRLTTRDPSLDQLAVSITALQAVLAAENPADMSEVDRLGMEVVA